MYHYEEHEERRKGSTHQGLVVTDHHGQQIPMDFQPAFDVLKDLNLDKHINEEERRFLRVQ